MIQQTVWLTDRDRLTDRQSYRHRDWQGKAGQIYKKPAGHTLPVLWRCDQVGTPSQNVASCKFGQMFVLYGWQHYVKRVRLSQNLRVLTKSTHGISCRNARASQRCEYCQYLNNFISHVLGPPDLGLIEKRALYRFWKNKGIFLCWEIDSPTLIWCQI